MPPKEALFYYEFCDIDNSQLRPIVREWTTGERGQEPWEKVFVRFKTNFIPRAWNHIEFYHRIVDEEGHIVAAAVDDHLLIGHLVLKGLLQ